MNMNLDRIKSSLVKITAVTFVLAMAALPIVLLFYKEAEAVSRAKINACKADYYVLCGDYTAVPEIAKCFKSKWHLVSSQCKESK